jgi:hypothetical protein
MLPIEFIVSGIPASLQAKSAKMRAWKEEVEARHGIAIAHDEVRGRAHARPPERPDAPYAEAQATRDSFARRCLD